MSDDLIKREDAIRWVKTECNPYGKPTLDFESGKKVIEHLEHMPSADRPQAKWIFHYRDKMMVKAECPKCHRRFEFSPRWIWKCCPMCETRMKGVDDETDKD